MVIMIIVFSNWELEVEMEKPEHILLKYAQTYVREEKSLAPQDCYYDSELGVWKLSETDQIFVETSERAGPSTKKQDVETGEDQKGE